MTQQYYRPQAWSVTEESYQPELNEFHESIFSLANGYMGVRATPEEGFSGGTGSSPGTYVANVYDLIKSHCDWRVGYVNECSVTVVAPTWYGMEVTLGGQRFDPRTGKVLSYRRTLDLKTGTLVRTLVREDPRGRQTDLTFTRIVSQADRHVGAIRLELRPINWNGKVSLDLSLDGEKAPQQTQVLQAPVEADGATLLTKTLITGFQTALTLRSSITCAGQTVPTTDTTISRDKYIARRRSFAVRRGQSYFIDKLVAVCSSRDGQKKPAGDRSALKAATLRRRGFEAVLQDHTAAWAAIWRDNDIEITGDAAAQQGIRFCVFHIHQSYAGIDPLVNIAAKGLSGPGYGGLYWWDTEAYMVPFFLYTAPAKARTLLMYRYLTLAGARRKARRHSYDGAMFPWVTIDGEERSGDWDYGALEQHVSSAVTHAIRQYVAATGDREFLLDYGAEVVLETSRFWASRVNHTVSKGYVINVVTGPDEYAVAINNNVYTNYMARENLLYGLEVAASLRKTAPARWKALARKLKFDDRELTRWADIARNLYLPFNAALGIDEQDDTFLQREPFDIRKVNPGDLPAGKWQMNRRNGSQVMKQADVLLLMHMHNDHFTLARKLANYKYYEPKCTHESSLSPCIHSIIAAEVGLEKQAFDYYLRSARLDLDNVNGNTQSGLHTTSLAGTWSCIVTGFGGMRLVDGQLTFRPHLPKRWKSMAFTVMFRNRRLRVTLQRDGIHLDLEGDPLHVTVQGKAVRLVEGETTLRWR